MNQRISEITAICAHLLQGKPETDINLPDINLMLSFYKKNKFPLLAFKANRNGNSFFHSPEFISARRQNASLLKSLREEYLIVRNRWHQADITCIAIKSGGSFLPFPYTSDNLDLLIRKDQEAAARAILLELGYIELKNLEEPYKFLFRKFRGGVSICDIHLHTRVGWGVGFLDDEALWKRSCISPNDDMVNIPSPEDIILITLAHGFYENKCFSMADLLKIQNSCSEAIDWKYLMDTASKSGWRDGLSFGLAICGYLDEVIFRESSIPEQILDECRAHLVGLPIIENYYYRLRKNAPVTLPFSFSFSFSKYLFYRKILNDHRLPIFKRLYEVLRTTVRGIRLKTKIRPQSSFLISFSGLDGSGKTQHAMVLRQALRSCDLDARYYWSRCGTSGLTNLFSRHTPKVLTGNKTIQDNIPGTQGRREKLHNPFLRFVWSCLAITDTVTGYFFHVRLPLLTGKIVICDRYVYDATAEIISSLTTLNWLNRLSINMMIASVPKPDFAYFLDVPERIINERKDIKNDITYLSEMRSVYTKLANRYGLRIKNNNDDFYIKSDEIVTEVITAYFQRYPTLINGLFLSNPNQLNSTNEVPV
jgi:dTMP kinase